MSLFFKYIIFPVFFLCVWLLEKELPWGWLQEEKEKLSEGIKKYGTDAKMIQSNLLPHKHLCLIKEKIARLNGGSFAWSQAELDKLRAAVRQCGPDWVSVSEIVGTRTRKQCLAQYTQLKEGASKQDSPQGNWTKEECTKLRELIAQYGLNWERISVELGSTRTPASIGSFYRSSKLFNYQPERWTPQEDAELIEIMKHHSKETWMVIAKILGSRHNHRSCYYRWLDINPFIIDGPWTNQERKKLTELAKLYNNKWHSVSRALLTRSTTQCIDEWCRMNFPDFRVGGWSQDETESLIALTKLYNKNWNKISSELGTRTPEQCTKKFMYLTKSSYSSQKNTTE